MNSLKNCSGTYQVWTGRGNALPKRIFIASFCLTFLLGCGPSSKEINERMAYAEKSKAVADSVSAYVPGIATDTINGVTHNFIRKADVKCRVKDVLSTTRRIEEIARELGGYVTQSNLNSENNYSQSIQVKKDSVMELIHFTTSSNLMLRIPAPELDSLLNKITAMAQFVDFRHIQASDVKLKLFANQLAERRYAQYKQRVQSKSDINSGKLNQNVNAEENVLEKQALADNKRVESYELADEVNYCTVSCTLYQPSSTYTALLPSSPRIEVYEPSFGNKLGEAFLNGFDVLKTFIIGLANAWSILLILFFVFLMLQKIILYYNRRPEVVKVENKTE
jgi:hypothetical protein